MSVRRFLMGRSRVSVGRSDRRPGAAPPFRRC